MAMFASGSQRQLVGLESDTESQVGGEGAAATHAPEDSPRSGTSARRWLPVAGLAGALAFAGVVLATRSVSSQTRVNTDSDVGLSFLDFADRAARGLDTTAGLVNDVDGLASEFNKTKAFYHKLKSEAEDKLLGEAAVPKDDSWRRFLSNSAPILPNNSLHDGNVCADDEELLMKLCYKKCSLLTNGDYPIRTTAWSCCRERPCTLFNQIFKKLSVCGGFDVSGDSAGNACPHAVGSCLADEELHLGLCYKKCSVLTEGEYMWRTAISTCCKVHNKVACMLPDFAKTSPAFQVGGGGADGDKETPARVHRPLTILTEKA